MKIHRLFPVIALSFSACQVGPDFELPNWLGGSRWKHVDASSAPLPDAWWKLFNDRELNQLVDQSLKANPSLAEARARVMTSRALVGVDRARMFPMLDLAGSGVSQRYSRDAVGAQLPAGLNIPLERDHFRGTFDLSYDLDLWGKNRRLLEASQADAAAVMASYDSQRLGLAAEVARQYFLLRGLDRQSSVLRDTIESRKQTVEMEQDQLKAGLVDRLSTTGARTELELARNDLLLVQRQRGAAEHAMAVLCGKMPAEFDLAVRQRAGGQRLPAIQPGLTAEVLSRRPDVRGAEQQLRAANARIGVAEAAFYPSFNLLVSGGYESISPSRFLDWQNRVFSLGAGVAAPIFRGGSNRATWQAAVSRRDEALANYKNSLLVALREVEDALLDLKGLELSRKALSAALVSSREAQAAVRERANNGLMSQFDLVIADRHVLGLELQLAECEANQRITVAILCKSLGGGWKS